RPGPDGEPRCRPPLPRRPRGRPGRLQPRRGCTLSRRGRGQALARAGAAMAAGGPYRLEPGARGRPRGQRATVDAEGLAIRPRPGGPARTSRAGKVVCRGTEGVACPVEGGGGPT